VTITKRIVDAAIGAAFGWLAAAVLIVADPPRLVDHPVALAGIATLAGLAIGLADRLRQAAYVIAALAALAGVVMLTPVVSGPVARWMRRDPIPTTPLEAVVVLSAGLLADSSLNVSGAERLVGGIAFARSTNTPMIVTTRIVATLDQRRLISSDSAQTRLVRTLDGGVDWRTVQPVHTTHDEAARAAALLLPLGKRRIAVVTSPMHARRACATFEAVGFRVTCTPSDEWAYSVRLLHGPRDRLRAAFELGYERLAMIEYRKRGWVRER